MKQTLLNRLNFSLHYLYLRLFDKDFRKLHKIRIANSFETIDKIVEHRMSISRFGDGELSLLNGMNCGFQKANPLICSKLQNILLNKSDGLLVGLPYVWQHPWKLKYRAFEYWIAYLSKNLSKNILPCISSQSQYYDSTFTRFYIDYRSSKHAAAIVDKCKNIWENRDICFIEGEFSRLGIGNDFFDNTKSIKRIICPSKNAFDVYDDILRIASAQAKDTLFLISLGMTATCLAFDLHSLGFQAIDTGHIDVEYEWYKMGATEKVDLPYKFVAESEKNNPATSIADSFYHSQIIAQILK